MIENEAERCRPHFEAPMGDMLPTNTEKIPLYQNEDMFVWHAVIAVTTSFPGGTSVVMGLLRVWLFHTDKHLRFSLLTDRRVRGNRVL